jgi:hypothetical protein
MDLKKIKEHIPYIIFLVVLTGIYMYPHMYNNKLPANDLSTSYHPALDLLKISAKEYKDFWPLWNPYKMSGTPNLMRPERGLDSLYGLLVLTIPSTTLALKLSFVFLFLLSGISMYIFMIYLKLDKKFALISALVYMLNGHMSKLLIWGWLTTLGGYSILPLAFLFGMKAIKEKEWIKNSIIAGVIFALLFRFGPDMKVGIWLGLLFGLYIIFDLLTKFSHKKLLKVILVSLIIITIFFGLSAQRMLPVMDFIKETSRGNTSWEVSSGRQLSYKDMFNRLIEPLYSGMPKVQRTGSGDHIGIIAFLLLLLVLFRKYKNKIVLFFAIGAVFSVLLASNTFKLYYLLWRFVPFFNGFRYVDRSLLLYAFCCSILVGFGAQELFKIIKKYKKQAYVVLIILILLDIWVFSYSHFLGNPKEEWGDAQEAIKNNYILQNLSHMPGLFRIQTWETHGIDWGTDFYNIPLGLEHIYGTTTTWYPPYMNVYLSVAFNNPAKFWGILNLKYLTSREELNLTGFTFVKKFDNCTVCWPKEENFAKAWGPYLYENDLFLPRAYMVDYSILVVGEEDSVTQTIYGLMLSQNFEPYNTVIIRGKTSINDYSLDDLQKYTSIFLTKGSIDQSSIFKLQQYVGSGGILLPDVTNNQDTISNEQIIGLFDSFKGELKQIDDKNIIMDNFDKREIRLNGQKGFLVYSEKFSVFDGWTVKDQNRNKLELLNADSMISAVYLDGRENNLTFIYKPRSYIIGLYITLITLALVVFYFVTRIVKYKKVKYKEITE